MSRRWVSTNRVMIAAAFACSGGAALVTACEEDSSSGPPGVGLDASSAFDSRAPADGVSGEGGSGRDAGPNDAGPDAPAYDYTTCKTLKEATPSLPSGVYDIDLDNEASGYPTLRVYCDMTFAGGGWTLLQSFTGAETTNALTLPAGPDGGYLTAPPRPGALGGLAGWVAQQLAEKSTQVHIRYSFAADAAAADMDAGAWITSREPEAGQVTAPIKNLRNLDTMSKGTDGGFEDWLGPNANATRLSWVPGGYDCLALTNTRRYPDVLWSCGNFESLNVISERVSWRWNDGSNQPIEVYLR